MNQAGRKSASSLSVISGGLPRIIEPPGSLNAMQASLWRGIVATKPSDWFDSDSIPLLVNYVRLICEQERVAKQLEAFDTECLTTQEGLFRYEKLIGVSDKISARIIVLATKMRLTQQSRINPQSAGVHNRKAAGARPWAVLENERH